jgi:hypothetical protein
MGYRVPERLRNGFLAGDVGKSLWPPFAGNDLIGHEIFSCRIKVPGS